MKKLLILLSIMLSGSLLAQTPMIPIRLTLSQGQCEPGSTAYFKFLIHDGNTNRTIWSNTLTTPDMDPIYGLACRLDGLSAGLFLGDTAIPNMNPLPENLFGTNDFLKLRIWLAKKLQGPYSLLHPDLTLLPSPYSLHAGTVEGFDQEVFAGHSSDIAGLKSSSATMATDIKSLKKSDEDLLTGKTKIPSAYCNLEGRLVIEPDGSVTCLGESLTKYPAGPPEIPHLYGKSGLGITDVGIKLNSTQDDRLLSVTLYFAKIQEVAPPAAVRLYSTSPIVTVLTSAKSVSTTDFPRCTYAFDAALPKGEYFLGLGTAKDYSAIFPYVCKTYRGGYLYYSWPMPSLDSVMADQKIWSQERGEELWMGLRLKSDQTYSLASGEDGILRQKDLDGAVAWNMLNSDLRSRIVTTDGGKVTGRLEVASLDLSCQGNWTVGSESKRCDLVLAHSNACLRAEKDLLLEALGEIRAGAFLNFSREQAGLAAVPPYETYCDLPAQDLTSEAVAILTPAQNTLQRHWLEIKNSRARIVMEEPTNCVQKFHYFIIKK